MVHPVDGATVPLVPGAKATLLTVTEDPAFPLAPVIHAGTVSLVVPSWYLVTVFDHMHIPSTHFGAVVDQAVGGEV